MGGAKSLVEAMCAGIRIAFAAHHPILGGSQFAYEGAITLRMAADLGAHVGGAELYVVFDQALRVPVRRHFARGAPRLPHQAKPARYTVHQAYPALSQSVGIRHSIACGIVPS